MWYDEKSGQWYSVRNSQDVAVIIRECFSESLADIIEAVLAGLYAGWTDITDVCAVVLVWTGLILSGFCWVVR